MPTPFKLVSKFRGYTTKPDPTNVDERVLISPSQNVLVNNGEKVVTRGGFSLHGAAGTLNAPVRHSFTWPTSTEGVTRYLRAYDDELEWLDQGTSGDDTTWRKLADGWATDADFSFTTYWNSTDNIDVLLFVVGNANIYEWSGAVTRFSSVAATTITKQGSNTWAQDRFFTSGTRSVSVLDDGGTWRSSTYTGGESTATLTGLGTDLTGFTISAGQPVIQALRTNSNVPASGYNNDVVATLNNQLWVGSFSRRVVYFSSNTSFTTYTTSSPRVAGEGGSITLDDVTSALIPHEREMYISSGRDRWYRSRFEFITVSTTLSEQLTIRQLNSSPGQGARSPWVVGKLNGFPVFLSHEPALRMLLRVDAGAEGEQKEEIRFVALSDPIKPDFDAENWANSQLFFHSNRIHLSAPASGKTYILQQNENENGVIDRYWQPPQLLPFRSFYTVGQNLYAGSNGTNETYRVWDGTSDNGNSIQAIARFPYLSFGDRANLKTFNEWMTEGYMSGNVQLTLRLRYDYEGYTSTLEKVILGSDTDITFGSVVGSALGEFPLGEEPLGGRTGSSSPLANFHVRSSFAPQPFFKVSAEYESVGIDQQWEIVSYGPSVRISPLRPTFVIK